jgi:SAM-dependent methyltransferase
MESASINADAFNAFEAGGWERKSAGYDEFFGRITSRLVDPLLDAAEVKAGDRVLDVATGPGYVAARAAERGAEVIGIDIAASMVDLARARNPGIEFRRGDAESLSEFEDGSFDAVVANFLVLHLARPERAAAELARVLAPGGRLALTAWDVPDKARFLGVFLDAVAEAGASAPGEIPKGPDFFRFSVDQEFAALIGGAGLDDVEVRAVSFVLHSPSTDDLWNGLLGGTVRTSALIEGQSADIQQHIREAFERVIGPYRSDQGLELPVSVKLASGRKPASG